MQAHYSRRRFVKAGITAAGALLCSRGLPAREGIVPTMMNAAAKAKINIQPLRRNIVVLEGSGGNIAVLSGRDGKLLVDAGFEVSRPAISAALASIDNGPLTQLVNTHWHTDHTNGNGWLHASGATITAHENTKKHLAQDTRVEAWNYTFPAVPAGALPTQVFSKDRKFTWNETTLLMNYYPPAHTDSDISVRFVEADIVHVGDTWWNNAYPFIDYSTGGSIAGSIRAAEANLELVTAKTLVIPGHGAVGRRPELVEFRDMLVAIRDKVASLKKQGRTLDETVAAKPTAAYDAKWGQFLTTPASFTSLVYMGV